LHRLGSSVLDPLLDPRTKGMKLSSERNIRFKCGFIMSLENEETGASPSVSIMRAFRLMADYIESLMGSVGRVLGWPSSRRRQMGRCGSGWSSSRLRWMGRCGSGWHAGQALGPGGSARPDSRRVCVGWGTGVRGEFSGSSGIQRWKKKIRRRKRGK